MTLEIKPEGQPLGSLRVLILGYEVYVPNEVQARGGEGVARWIADELTSKQLLPFNPHDRTIDELEDALQEVDDTEVLHAMKTVAVRSSVPEVLEARRREIDEQED